MTCALPVPPCLPAQFHVYPVSSPLPTSFSEEENPPLISFSLPACMSAATARMGWEGGMVFPSQTACIYG